MGHIRLKQLPASRKWRQVVELLGAGGAIDEIAAASADASDRALEAARNDPVLGNAFWLLTQLPLAARAPDFEEAGQGIGVDLGEEPSLVDIVAAFSEAVDRDASGRTGRTDLGEMARNAAAESLTALVGADLQGLFGTTSEEVQQALGKFAAPDQFARLARDFFARLTQRHLDYYLSRALPHAVGPSQTFSTVAEHSAFNAALERFSAVWAAGMRSTN